MTVEERGPVRPSPGRTAEVVCRRRPGRGTGRRGVDHPQAPVAVIVADAPKRARPGPSAGPAIRWVTRADGRLEAGELSRRHSAAVESASTAMARRCCAWAPIALVQVHDGELYSNVVGIDIAVVNVTPVAVVGVLHRIRIGEG